MNTAAETLARASRRPVLIVVLLLVAWGFGWFIVQNFPRYLVLDPASWGTYYWPRRMGLLPHIAGGLVAAIAGLVQLWLGLTGRTGPLHRVLGRAYAVGILVGAAGSFYMSLTIPPGEAAYAVGLFALGVAWLLTTGLAVFAARRRNFAQHRDWMLRSYTVTFAFAAYRIADNRLGPMHLMPQEQLDAMIAWGCWALPLLLMEPVIQWQALARRPRA